MDGIKVFNYVRQATNETFMSRVPSATPDNISTLKNILFADDYKTELNQFVSTLLNKFAMQVIMRRRFESPFNVFKRAMMPLGVDTEVDYVNPASAEDYELSTKGMGKLLSMNYPDVKSVIVRRNRQDKYKVTIAHQALYAAFQSYEALGDFVASIIDSLENGDQIDSFNYVKDLISSAFERGYVNTITIDPITDQASAKSAITKARALAVKMRFPSTEYNGYTKVGGKGEVKTWTPADRQFIIMTADLEAQVDVEVLAAAFNMSKADFLGRRIVVDSFRDPQIQMVICDESWIINDEQLRQSDEFYNAEVMAWNHYLHVWGTFATNPLANCVMLVTGEANGATEISANDLEVELGSTTPLVVTMTPENASSTYTVVSQNPGVASVSPNGAGYDVVANSVGNTELLITASSGVTHLATVTVTAPASEPKEASVQSLTPAQKAAATRAANKAAAEAAANTDADADKADADK